MPGNVAGSSRPAPRPCRKSMPRPPSFCSRLTKIDVQPVEIVTCALHDRKSQHLGYFIGVKLLDFTGKRGKQVAGRLNDQKAFVSRFDFTLPAVEASCAGHHIDTRGEPARQESERQALAFFERTARA